VNVNGTTSAALAGHASYLARPGGRIGYDVAGTGLVLVLVPGLGDLRAGYRFLAQTKGTMDAPAQARLAEVTAPVLRFLAALR